MVRQSFIKVAFLSVLSDVLQKRGLVEAELGQVKESQRRAVADPDQVQIVQVAGVQLAAAQNVGQVVEGLQNDVAPNLQ